MKNMGDMLTGEKPFSEIVMGNTALVRAMVESGVRVVTTYPGSPTPEIASAILSIPSESRPFYFEYSTNEKVATEVALGASVNGHLSCVFFKSVGLNVAADSFVQLSHMNLTGGLVAILGDDPGANSSQNEQDNRHYARLAFIPVLEPATPQEAYSMFKEAAKLSAQKQMPIIIRMTTHVCHGKQKVSFEGWNRVTSDDSPRFAPSNGPYIPITSEALKLKRVALQKLKEIQIDFDESPLNRVILRGKRRGVITAGLPFKSLEEVLHSSPERPDILKLGTIYPLPEKRVLEFIRTHEEVKILEELDDCLERDIKALAFDNHVDVKITGKINLDDWIGEYTPDKVAAIIHRIWPDMIAMPEIVESAPISPRPAQMCPGCGHRSAFYAIKKALSEDDITVADIGCHTLGFLPPYRMGEILLSMGHSSGTASGLSLFNDTRNVVAFLGDSTFFHAGIPGIVNAIFNNHNFTLIIMENGTTAMTGHQDHAGSGFNASGPTEKIAVKSVLQGLGVTNIRETDTYNQHKLTQMVKESLSERGFSVVIARHPCMLKFMSTQRKKEGYIAKHVEIDQARCDRTKACIEDFACPSFKKGKDGSISVNEELCIGDGSCIQTCPSKAIAHSESKDSKGGI